MSRQPALLRGVLLQAAVLCAILAVLPAVAMGAPEAPAETPQSSRSLVFLTDDEAVHLSPLLQEIRVLLIGERSRVEALTNRLAKTMSHERAFALQHEISAIKEQTEIDVLKAQARYAEAEGRIEQVREIRAAVEILEARLERRREEIAGRP